MPSPEFDVGTYWGEFVCMRDDKSPNSGTPYVALTFKILDYWHNDKWEEAFPGDRQRDVRMFVTEAAEPYTIQQLERLGWNGDFEQPAFSTFEDGCTMLECSINKEGYENWGFPRTLKEQDPWDANERRRFAAKYKQQAKRDVVPPKSKAPSAPPPAPKTAPPSRDNGPVRDDEIPGGATKEGAAELLDVAENEIPF